MIKVYAIDPQALFDPVIAQSLEQFGYHHGRVIGCIPAEWEKEVKELYRKHFGFDKKMEIRLVRLAKKRVYCRLPLQGKEEETWIKRAVAVDKRLLKGIIVNDKKDASDCRVIDGDDLHDENKIWAAETGILSPRTAEEMADTVSVILGHANDLKFVDAYFAGESKHLRYLQACLSLVDRWQPRRSIWIEIHFLYSGDFKDGSEERKRKADSVFATVLAKTRKDLAGRCRSGIEVSLFQWGAREGSPRFHERFLISELVVVDFGGGLDTGKSTQKTTVKLLGASTIDELRKVYSPASDSFQLFNKASI